MVVKIHQIDCVRSKIKILFLDKKMNTHNLYYFSLKTVTTFLHTGKGSNQQSQ